MGDEDGVDEDKSTRCETLPQAEVAFPVRWVDRDDDLGVVPAERERGREGERERGQSAVKGK